MLSSIVRSVCAVTLLALTSVPAVAQPLDKRVVFNFSGPVTLPGVTLPAGSYLFRVPTPNRNVVQVLSADGTKIYGTFFAIGAHRSVRPENPEVRFMETRSGTPHAIRTWWYPADSTEMGSGGVFWATDENPSRPHFETISTPVGPQ